MKTKAHQALPLSGREISISSQDISSEYSARLLRSLGAETVTTGKFSAQDVSRDWAASGLVPLTGYPDAPLQGPAAIPSAARGALDALKLLAGPGGLAGLSGAALLSERAAYLRLSRQGQISANGSCRFLRCSDGWIALNLARNDDWRLLPALFESSSAVSSWDVIADQAAAMTVSRLLEQGRLLGLPVAPVAEPSKRDLPWFSTPAQVARASTKRVRPLVVDLSSLWAGPLCTHLLQLSGARVIKVESTTRPDGARAGNEDFFDLLNGAKESVVFDLSQDTGVQQVLALMAQADIVVEASRPRALKQLGIDAEELIETIPGLTWVSITGYGRAEPTGNWVAFGDDAGAAAGAAMACVESPVFCGDALADPLTGIHAALAAMAFWQSGGGVLIDLSLVDVTAHCLNFYSDVERGSVVHNNGKWQILQEGHRFEVSSPAPRRFESKAAIRGGDTRKILDEFNLPC